VVERGAATSSMLREYVLVKVEKKSLLRVSLSAANSQSLKTSVALIAHKQNASSVMMARSIAWAPSNYAPDPYTVGSSLGDGSRQLMKHSLEVCAMPCMKSYAQSPLPDIVM
jgi:hypothetical protein